VSSAIGDAHHALMAALMVWMVVMPMPMPMPMDEGMAGMAMDASAGTSPGNGPAPVVLLVAYCFVATFVLVVQAGRVSASERSVRRLPAAAGHAAMSLGAGVLTLAMS
jgi:hypothetical protein